LKTVQLQVHTVLTLVHVGEPRAAKMHHTGNIALQQHIEKIRFGATVCKTVRSMLSDRRLSVLSLRLSCLFVTLMYCGQTVGWIKMKLGKLQVGLGPGHTVLDGDDPSPPCQRGTAPPIFAQYLLWPSGSMDQDATW